MLVAAHGNSLRSMVMAIEGLTPDEILKRELAHRRAGGLPDQQERHDMKGRLWPYSWARGMPPGRPKVPAKGGEPTAGGCIASPAVAVAAAAPSPRTRCGRARGGRTQVVKAHPGRAAPPNSGPRGELGRPSAGTGGQPRAQDRRPRGVARGRCAPEGRSDVAQPGRGAESERSGGRPARAQKGGGRQVIQRALVALGRRRSRRRPLPPSGDEAVQRAAQVQSACRRSRFRVRRRSRARGSRRSLARGRRRAGVRYRRRRAGVSVVHQTPWPRSTPPPSPVSRACAARPSGSR